LNRQTCCDSNSLFTFKILH